MARNGRKKRAKDKAFSIANRLFPVAKAATPIIAFLEQISAKDRQTLGSSFSNATTFTQLKILSNIVTGRLAGFGFFHGQLANTIPPQTLNPSGVINKWTAGGLAGMAYGLFGKAINKQTQQMGLGSFIPATAKIKALGKGAFAGGLFGGFFDDPANDGRQTSHNLQSFPSLRASQPQLQLLSSRSTVGRTNGDPVVSGMS